MEVIAQSASLTEVSTPMLVVNLFEGVTEPGGACGAVDAALGGLIRRLIASGEIRGEAGQVVVLHNSGHSGLAAERVAVVGLGKQERFSLETVRCAAASVVRKARELRVLRLATIVHGAGAGGLDFGAAVRAVTEGSLLAGYEYRRYLTAPDPPPELESVTIVERDPTRRDAMHQAVELGRQTAQAVMLARDLATGPSNLVTPTYLAEQAQAVAREAGLDCTVLWKEDLQRLGMGGILAVNQGSAQPPCLTILRYDCGLAGAKTLAVVGKGITFDSGGISLKSADGMGAMKQDMCGAAAVIGFCQLASRSKLPVNVLGVFAATENLPSGTAYKPGDIHRAYNGKTMEIVNTDAEGRVILSDALSYVAEQKPDAIIDLATLTSACVVALGHYASGVMGDEALIALLRQAGDTTGERVWPLPLWDVYAKEIETPVADMKNTGGRPAGAITAAAFLKNFVADVPWAHLDIAGTAWVEDQAWIPPYQARGNATGVGIRLLHEFCQLWAAS